MDVTSEESVREAVGQVLERAGRIDVLINNAGLGIVGPLEETTDALIYEVSVSYTHLDVYKRQI